MISFQKQNFPSGGGTLEINPGVDLQSLKAFLHPSYPGRVVTLGIGNRLRGDDGAGPELVTRLKEKWVGDEKQDDSRDTRFFIDAGESPEDWFIRVLELHPEVIIVVDAVALQSEPGSVAVLEAQTLPESFLFSTHRLPLRSLLQLWGENDCKTLVLAIQPETLEFGQGLSPRVKESINQLINFFSPARLD
jgi:hydrogenase 3 maturation protease